MKNGSGIAGIDENSNNSSQVSWELQQQERAQRVALIVNFRHRLTPSQEVWRPESSGPCSREVSSTGFIAIVIIGFVCSIAASDLRREVYCGFNSFNSLSTIALFKVYVYLRFIKRLGIPSRWVQVWVGITSSKTSCEQICSMACKSTSLFYCKNSLCE